MTTLILNEKIYPIEAILNTCQSFLDRFFIFLDDKKNDGNISIILNAKRKMSANELKLLEGEFMNEALHCALRYKISKNNKKIREYIINKAIYGSLSLINENLLNTNERLEYQDDPLGIAVPWEEKYAKQKK